MANFTVQRKRALEIAATAQSNASDTLKTFRKEVSEKLDFRMSDCLANSERVFRDAARVFVAGQLIVILRNDKFGDAEALERIKDENNSAMINTFGSSSTSQTSNLSKFFEAKAWVDLMPPILALLEP